MKKSVLKINTANNKNSYRPRVTIPLADKTSVEFIQHQASLSNSIRTLAHYFMEILGPVDVTCLSKAELIELMSNYGLGDKVAKRKVRNSSPDNYRIVDRNTGVDVTPKDEQTEDLDEDLKNDDVILNQSENEDTTIVNNNNDNILDTDTPVTDDSSVASAIDEFFS